MFLKLHPDCTRRCNRGSRCSRENAAVARHTHTGPTVLRRSIVNFFLQSPVPVFSLSPSPSYSTLFLFLPACFSVLRLLTSGKEEGEREWHRERKRKESAVAFFMITERDFPLRSLFLRGTLALKLAAVATGRVSLSLSLFLVRTISAHSRRFFSLGTASPFLLVPLSSTSRSHLFHPLFLSFPSFLPSFHCPA